MAHSRMFAAAACLSVAALGLTGCGGGGSAGRAPAKGPVAFADIDQEAWTADLVAAGDVRANPDLESLYRLAKDDCKKSIDDLALGFTLSGARPDVDRINMSYVCPSQARNVDKALKSVRDTQDEFDKACSTPEELRTQKQRDMVEAVGCNP